MENIERQLVRINNSINNIYSSINVLSNALLIQQTNSLIDSLRHSRPRPRPRPTNLFTTPTPPAPPPRTSTTNLADILGSIPPPPTQFNPETSRASASATSPGPGPSPGPGAGPGPAPTTLPQRTDLNRRRRDDNELFNSFFTSLMSNDFANMEVSLLGVTPPFNPIPREENIVISHHNIFTNTKVLVKKYDREVFLDATENSNDSGDEESEIELEKCTICQDYIRENSVVRQINKCKHTFHIECADRWFQDNIKCPHCRQDIRENVN